MTKADPQLRNVLADKLVDRPEGRFVIAKEYLVYPELFHFRFGTFQLIDFVLGVGVGVVLGVVRVLVRVLVIVLVLVHGVGVAT